MNDPHVERLVYQLRTGEGLEFDSPPPVEFDEPAFHVRLENHLLIASMKEHHASEETARVCVEGWLRTWEMDLNLIHHRRLAWFEFIKADCVDRKPAKPGDVALMRGTAKLRFAASGRLTGIRNAYPPPPTNFIASPHVEAMWFRYQMFLEGKEPVLSMAYACLSLLEGTTGMIKGARNAVCQKYNIEEALRDKFGDIVSEKGGPTEARKLNASASHVPLTEDEKCWVAAVVRAFIRRKGEYDANPTATFPAIALADFPPV